MLLMLDTVSVVRLDGCAHLNLPRSGALAIAPRATRSVFERYNIVSDSDLREAARKLQSAQ
jgi:hypothetical protein